MYVHNTGKDKLDPHAIQGCLLGYTNGVKGYRIWNPKTRKVIHFRHVTFDEYSLMSPKKDTPSNPVEDTTRKEQQEVDLLHPFKNTAQEKGKEIIQHTSSFPNECENRSESSHQDGPLDDTINQPVQTSKRTIKPPERYGDWICANMSFSDQFD